VTLKSEKKKQIFFYFFFLLNVHDASLHLRISRKGKREAGAAGRHPGLGKVVAGDDKDVVDVDELLDDRFGVGCVWKIDPHKHAGLGRLPMKQAREVLVHEVEQDSPSSVELGLHLAQMAMEAVVAPLFNQLVHGDTRKAVGHAHVGLVEEEDGIEDVLVRRDDPEPEPRPKRLGKRVEPDHAPIHVEREHRGWQAVQARHATGVGISGCVQTRQLQIKVRVVLDDDHVKLLGDGVYLDQANQRTAHSKQENNRTCFLRAKEREVPVGLWPIGTR